MGRGLPPSSAFGVLLQKNVLYKFTVIIITIIIIISRLHWDKRKFSLETVTNRLKG